MDTQLIYFVWDVFECRYSGAVQADDAETAMQIVTAHPELWADNEGMGYEIVTSFLATE